MKVRGQELELHKDPMPGWPYSDFATGWYQIGYSEDLEVGDIQAAHWLNQELVLFRTESGQLKCLDAFCPHMGAHLGQPGQFGGKVCGENIQCPWHGWLWDGEGKNVDIPYSDKTVNATIPNKHIRETDGCIFMWFDSEGSPPSYEFEGLPYIGDEEDYYPIDYTVDGPHRVKPQFPMENSADPHHFIYVHGSGLDAEFNDYTVDGPKCSNTMYMEFGHGKESTWLTPNGPVTGHVDNFFVGASIGIARFNIDGRVCIHMTNLTPIDDHNCMFFSSIRHNKEPGDTGNVSQGLAKRMTAEQHIQIRNDFHIWANMKYKVKPIFTGPEEQSRYAFIRRHFDQFYPNPVYKENRG